MLVRCQGADSRAVTVEVKKKNCENERKVVHAEQEKPARTFVALKSERVSPNVRVDVE